MAETPEQVAYLRTIPGCKDFLPLPVRFMLFVVLIVVYQFTGGVYMSAIIQMAGSSSWWNEDILMAGYSSLIGMTMVFPVQFNLLARFENRTTLIFSTTVLMVGTLICMYSTNLLVVIIASFICGIFKMVATFFCITNIHLRITPTRDLAHFYPFLYTLILCCIQLSGIATGYCIWAWDWKAMHLVIIGVLAITLLVIMLTMKHNHRMGPPMPNNSMDYLGALLWSLFLICILYIALYGSHYDWWQGKNIRIATIFSVIALLLAIYHARTNSNPFIHLATFIQPKFFIVAILFVSYSMLSGTAGQIQNMFTDGILGFDMFHSISLNWPVVVGICCGTVFSYWALVHKKMRKRDVAIIGFSFFTMYEIMIYFLIMPDTEYRMLIGPMWMRGVGNAILYIILAFTLGKNVPFKYYFQALCAIGFIRTGVGVPVCQSFLSHLLTVFRKESYMTLSQHIEPGSLPSVSSIYGELQKQTLMVGLKEVFGLAALIGIVTIIGLCCSDIIEKIKHKISNKTIRSTATIC